MARILAIVDRRPDDPDWKGAAAWKMIHSLAESQHEVRVLTTEDPAVIHWAHPRLTVTRPSRSWSATELPKLMQAIWSFQPEVIHSFSLRTSSLWPALSVWPWLSGLTKVLPNTRRWSTLFDSTDLQPKDATFPWHVGGHGLTVPSRAVRETLRRSFLGTIETLPLDLDVVEPMITSPSTGTIEPPFALIPAPVNRWRNPWEDLRRLAEFLRQNPELKVLIVGGWGEFSPSRRKKGWLILSGVMSQVRMTDPLSLAQLLPYARTADRLWLEPLDVSSWTATVAFELARSLDKEVHALSGAPPPRTEGSAANFLSRLYTQS